MLHPPGPGEESQKLQGREESIHGSFFSIPADSKLAISPRSLAAASIKPMSTQAPVPSPGRSARQGAKKGCRAAGVADPHRAGAEEKKIFQGDFFDETNSRFDGSHSLESGHGGAAREILGAAANFAVAQPWWVGKFVIH